MDEPRVNHPPAAHQTKKYPVMELEHYRVETLRAKRVYPSPGHPTLGPCHSGEELAKS
jgi:hypothetical protein